MSMTSEKIDGNMAVLTITVPAEDFNKELTVVYNKQKGKFHVDGFRKGHVPMAYIEKVYGPEVFYDDAANNLINKTYGKELEGCDLDIVSRPEIEVTQIGKGRDFIYTAKVATKPPVELGEYKGIEVEKTEITVTDEDVNAEIEKARQENSRTIEVTDRAAQLEDTAIINFEGFVDGVAFEGGKGESYSLKLGSHSFIDTFEDQIVGKNIGDEFDVNVTFPEEYQEESLAGKPAVFKVELLGIKATELPELDDDFASEVSEFETVDEYKEDIRKTLEVKKEAEAKRAKESKCLEKLIETSTIELPEPMIEYQQEKMLEDFGYQLSQQGLSLDQYFKFTGQDRNAMMEQVKPEAIKRIKTSLIVEAVAKAEDIKATDEEVEERLKETAERYQLDVEKFKELAGEKEEDAIRMDLSMEKAIKFIAENAKEV